jgi:predicted nucleotidyltransferase
MDLHHQIINEIKEKYIADKSTVALFVIGSVARGDYSTTSDIDLILITEQEPENNFEESLVNNLVVEIKKGTVTQYQAKMKEDPMQVWQFLDAKVLFDKNECLQALHNTASEVLTAYTPKNMDAVLKWLSSVKIKIQSAKTVNDTAMIGYQVSNILWKVVQGLYETNNMPTPASTTAYRRIASLKVLPKDFEKVWNEALTGDFAARTTATVSLIDFILDTNGYNSSPNGNI